MSRTERDAREPSECRSCKRLVLWVQWAKSGKRMPVDVTPHPIGNVVVAFRRAANLMIAETYDPNLHEKRNRYISHFTTCPQKAEWRKKE
jgi:hypothetical protein